MLRFSILSKKKKKKDKKDKRRKEKLGEPDIRD
jgi:hypothetical protein